MAFDEPLHQEERTEQPSARRRDEARRQGRVARSADLTAAVVLLGGLGVLSLAGERWLADAVDALRQALAAPPFQGPPEGALERALGVGLRAAAGSWLLVLGPAAAGVAVQLAQTRLALVPDVLQLRWERLDPLAGLRRLLGWRGLAELLRAALKLGAVGAVGVLTLRHHSAVFALTAPEGVGPALARVADAVRDLWLRVGLTFLALAVLDYAYQRWRHERGLRMTRQEVREELRQTEGEPLLRARLRSLHRQLAARRMMAEVRRADVVLRNPVMVAVALRYEPARMGAPRVVAKGARHLARRIVQVAHAAGVPVVENRPLARALFDAVPLGREIPPALYRAVAEVLAYVYSLRGGRAL